MTTASIIKNSASHLQHYLSNVMRSALKPELKDLISPLPHLIKQPTCLAQLVCTLPRYGVGMRLVDIDQLDPAWQNRTLLVTNVQFRATRLPGLDQEKKAASKKKAPQTNTAIIEDQEDEILLSSEQADFDALFAEAESQEPSEETNTDREPIPIKVDPAELAKILQVKPSRHLRQYRTTPLSITGMVCDERQKTGRVVRLKDREKYGIRWGVLA